MKVIGQLERAQLENTTLGTLPGATATGRVIADITIPSAAVPKFFDGTSWKSLFSSNNQANALQNLGLLTSVATNALTISLKQQDGATDPTSTSPVQIGMRSSTLSNGSYNLRSVTGALSIVVPSGATLGQTSAVNQYVWVYAIDNGGTIELAVSGVNVFPNNTIQSTVAITSGSTLGSTLYSTTLRTNVPIRLIGRLLVNETTAGTWGAAPTDVNINPMVVPNLTDLKSFTPTGSYVSNVNYAGVYRRVGDNAEFEVKVTFSAGTNTTNPATINIPASVGTIDLTKLANGAASAKYTNVGTLHYFDSSMGGDGYATGTVYVQSATTVGATAVQSGTTNGELTLTDTLPINTNGSTSLLFRFQVPISGWSTYGP